MFYGNHAKLKLTNDQQIEPLALFHSFSTITYEKDHTNQKVSTVTYEGDHRDQQVSTIKYEKDQTNQQVYNRSICCYTFFFIGADW